jgi:polyhydroxybutyrate depolymerase
MKKINTLLLILLPFLGFGQQTINETLNHGGLQRDYTLYIPSSYTPGADLPLVLNFHGYTSNAWQQSFYSNFNAVAEAEGFIVVYPDGTLDDQGTTHWNVGWGGSTVDDIGFTSALIDSISEDYSINQERVYSTGMSNGGFMSYQLACELSDRIAAIASVTGSMNIGWFNSCNPNHPIPVMEIHGDSDLTVSYNASSFTESIPDILDFWASFNNCNSTPVITSVPDINTLDGCTAEHSIWENGSNGATVEHYKIIDGEHTWPGALAITGVTNQDIIASEKIWEFFRRYDINGVVESAYIPEEVTQTTSRLLKITDLLGRETTAQANTPLFFIYEDGSVERKIIIE